MTRQQIIRRRRRIALLMGVAALVILIFLIRGAIGLIGKLTASDDTPDAPSAAAAVKQPQYDGTPVRISEYIDDEGDRPAVPWNLMLVNVEHPLAEGYVPVLATIETRWEVDERIADAAVQMLADCREAGLSPMICSAFRSVEKQQELFDDRIDRNKAGGMEDNAAREAAAEIVAIPGTSEHHTGLALDIVSSEYQLLDEGQEDTPEYQWLREHCAEYGFILRYPPDKTEETGIIYEPWHFRYVGKEAAREIMEQGITLEQYSEQES